jgi:hypothetical protein
VPTLNQWRTDPELRPGETFIDINVFSRWRALLGLATSE